jgi:hypothetical protein
MEALKSEASCERWGEENSYVTKQMISSCLIGGTACRFHLRYKEFTFCASEIMVRKQYFGIRKKARTL